MKPIQLAFSAIAVVAILLLLTRLRSFEGFAENPKYCTQSNSCLGQGCSLGPNQPCARSRTKTVTIAQNDPDWGSVLGGETVPVCVRSDGVTSIDPTTCAQCSQCGSVYPPTGTASARLCLPLTPEGCLNFTPSDRFLKYLNEQNPIVCCGLGRKGPGKN